MLNLFTVRLENYPVANAKVQAGNGITQGINCRVDLGLASTVDLVLKGPRYSCRFAVALNPGGPASGMGSMAKRCIDEYGHE